MNKKMMLILAGFIAVSPVLQVTASADAMYYDIKNIVEDKLTGKNDYERLYNVQNALRQARSYKEDAQNTIIQSHAQVDPEKVPGITAGVLGALFGGVSTAGYFGKFLVAQDVAATAMCSAMFTTLGFMILAKKQIHRYYSKKKINELDVVILRLEAMEKTLIQRLYPCGYCGY